MQASAEASANAARPALLVKLRPSRPWRVGPSNGDRDHIDAIFHSDTLYSALTHAMRLLGRLEYWLETTARPDPGEGGPPIRFTSMFPFHGETLYVTPPRHIWPPAASMRVRYASARFIPLSLVESIFAGKPLQDERWSVDGVSECLVPGGKSGPFRVSVRSSAAVDRLTGASEPHRTACLEFVPKAGLWFAVSFADTITRDQWGDPLRSAVRLLADSGFGGERSRGWGRAHTPEFREGRLPQLLYKGTTLGPQIHWTLSLVSPAESDQVDWERGSYSVTVRGGWVDSPASTGGAKKLLTMVEEGSVLYANTLEGSAPDVAPTGFSHPVYRAGWAFSISVPAEVPRQLEAVDEPPLPIAEVEALIAEEDLSTETPPDEVEEALPNADHLTQDDVGKTPTPLDETELKTLASEALALEEESQMPKTPREIPTSDEELERLESESNGGPDDDVAPPMNDPGPMEPPFSEPDDLTPIDPDPGPGGQPPGPNPDEPEEPAGPAE